MLTPEQLASRHLTLGASETAAVLNLSPFATPREIYDRKTLAVETPATDAMLSGTYLEGGIIAWLMDRIGCDIQTNFPTTIGPDGILSATPDGKISLRPEGVEAKLSGKPDEWGAEGTDEIPDHYLVQAQQQMYVMDWEVVWFPVLMLTGYTREFKLFRVGRDEEAIGEIVEHATGWWKRHVVTRTPPPNTSPTLELLKRVRREPESCVELGADALELVERWEASKATAKAASEAEEQAKALLLEQLGPAESGVLPDGRRLTFRSQNSAPKVDTTLLRAESPELAARVINQGTHRVLRVQKAK